MLFSGRAFLLLFLPIVTGVYYLFLRRSRRAQNIFLAFASLFFYAVGEPLFVLVMLLSIAGNWLFALLLARGAHRRLWLTVTCCFDLGILFVFKYLDFTVESIGRFVLHRTLPLPGIPLPIGISFFTFQALSYVIDVYRGTEKAQRDPLYVALYISFFPQLIAGPIVRYHTIADQIDHRRESFDLFSAGVCRFIVGLAKKIVLANNFAYIADDAFYSPVGISCGLAWLGAIAYTLQIYFDFSGYSDMAIGLGQMFGFQFAENFRYPYISGSVSEFWRRWHISLGSWFRDYVYFPLGGSRVATRRRLIFNLFVVWLLTGIWHGANWTFIAWGLMYFVLISLEKLTGFEKRHFWWGHLTTMLFVMFGWVFFRSNNITWAITHLLAMLGLGSGPLWDTRAAYYFAEYRLLLAAGCLACLPLRQIAAAAAARWRVRIPAPVRSAAYCVWMGLLFVVSLSYVVRGGYDPFIYFNF